MTPKSIFIDTWGWIVLGHRKDPHHQLVSSLYKSLRTAGALVYTSDYVIDELITLLFRREIPDEAFRFVERILSAAAQGFLIIERISPEQFAKAWELRLRFKDKPQISFTDFTTMIVMQERQIEQVLTDDKRFTWVGMGFKILP
ncbi:MAG TPA: PIN domain-containing protein [Firmicutes bacterium]|nr:PIN domain-containing protein [Bacillota bacterium]